MITVIPYGDSAVLINFDQKIDISINEKVLILNQKVKTHFTGKISFSIPAYCSLTIGYDPRNLSIEEIKKFVYECSFEDQNKKEKPRRLKIPVCYDDKHALDMNYLIEATGISKEEIISLHCSASYHVFMLGFLPGFPYLGPINEKLYCKRKLNPRKETPKGAVGIAGEQTGIYPQNSPGGWNIIGRTPIEIFNHKDENPFLFIPGDRVSFFPISNREYMNILDLEAKGRYQIEFIDGK